MWNFVSQFIDALFLFMSLGKYASIAAAAVVCCFGFETAHVDQRFSGWMQVVRVRHHTVRTAHSGAMKKVHNVLLHSAFVQTNRRTEREWKTLISEIMAIIRFGQVVKLRKLYIFLSFFVFQLSFVRVCVSVATILVSIYFKMPSMKTNYFMRNRFSIPSNSKERVIMTHFIWIASRRVYVHRAYSKQVTFYNFEFTCLCILCV